MPNMLPINGWATRDIYPLIEEHPDDCPIYCVWMPESQMPQDPFIADNRVYFTFLAEGAANAIFKIHPFVPEKPKGFPCIFIEKDGTVIPRTTFLSKVLRISKGKPKTLLCEDILSGFEKEIKPLFRHGIQHPKRPQHILHHTPPSSFADFLMEHEGVTLSMDVVEYLLEMLPERRCDSCKRSGRAPCLKIKGILLPDMSSIQGSALMIEIKPKWLAQSPNAPRDAYRCRTCALHASRATQAETPRDSYICPLQLVAGNSNAIERYLKYQISQELGEPKPELMAAILRRALSYLTTGPGHELLKHIQTLQAQLDPTGILLEDEVPDDQMDGYDRRLRLAMTLRDCSFFIRIPYADESRPIEAKLGDLDFKSIDKLPDWRFKEVGLVNGGWYTDLEAGVRECLIAEGWRRFVPHYM